MTYVATPTPVIKPPIGVRPWRSWIGQYDDDGPPLGDVVIRHAAVIAAIGRYRDAGLPVNPLWLEEVGMPTDRQLRRLQ